MFAGVINNIAMNKWSLLIPAMCLLGLSSCRSYEPELYGPVEFESSFEGPLFGEMVVDALVELEFEPENFGINREDIHSMLMREIQISTDYKNGFGDFDNIQFSVMADGVKSEKVATIKINGSPKELLIPGLAESEIKKFKDVRKFYLEITAVTKPELYEVYEDIAFRGSMTMDIMVPEK
jgi:hypothetical protein